VPDGAGILAPGDAMEATATRAFLTWLHDFADWAHERDNSASAAAKWCANRGKPGAAIDSPTPAKKSA